MSPNKKARPPLAAAGPNEAPASLEAAGPCCADLDRLFDPRFFRALGDPTRVAILSRLAWLGGEATVSRMTECCSVDLSVVSRHLATLREAGIVKAEKRGREVYYSVLYPELARMLRDMAAAIEACCPATAPCFLGPPKETT